MAKVYFNRETKISTFSTLKHTSVIHVGVNSPHEHRMEMNSKINNVLR